MSLSHASLSHRFSGELLSARLQIASKTSLFSSTDPAIPHHRFEAKDNGEKPCKFTSNWRHDKLDENDFQIGWTLLQVITQEDGRLFFKNPKRVILSDTCMVRDT